MEVDRKLIEHVASVARIKLTEAEIEKFLPQLKEAIEFFSKLQEVNTVGINPLYQPVEIRNALREDESRECLTQDEALSQTEHKKDGYFKGPRVV